MNNDFWNMIVKMWCKTFDKQDKDKIIEDAKKKAQNTQNAEKKHSRNPMDDL